MKILKWLNSHYRAKALFKTIISSILRLFVLNKGITKKIGNHKIVLDCYFAFSDYRCFGDGHNNGFNRLLELSRDRKVVFDIGAHIGLCAIPLSYSIADDGIVYAFEPGAANLKYLKKNIEYNKIENIKVFPYLVGSENNNAISFHESRAASAMNSIVEYKAEKIYKTVNKKQISLDYFCIQNNIIPEIIKIDVEGAEINVLAGAKRILKSYNPIIMLSVHPRHLRIMGSSVEELIQLIKSCSYEIMDIDGKKTAQMEFAEYILNPISVSKAAQFNHTREYSDPA